MERKCSLWMAPCTGFSNDIDPQVLKALSTPAGGEDVHEFAGQVLIMRACALLAAGLCFLCAAPAMAGMAVAVAMDVAKVASADRAGGDAVGGDLVLSRRPVDFAAGGPLALELRGPGFSADAADHLWQVAGPGRDLGAVVPGGADDDRRHPRADDARHVAEARAALHAARQPIAGRAGPKQAEEKTP